MTARYVKEGVGDLDSAKLPDLLELKITPSVMLLHSLVGQGQFGRPSLGFKGLFAIDPPVLQQAVFCERIGFFRNDHVIEDAYIHQVQGIF